jgi:hypothetical protein
MTNATKTERPSPNVIDAKTFWRTLGERAIGATIVTAQGADGPAGFLGLFGDASVRRSALHAGFNQPQDIGARRRAVGLRNCEASKRHSQVRAEIATFYRADLTAAGPEGDASRFRGRAAHRRDRQRREREFRHRTRLERFQEIADEFARLKFDIIVTNCAGASGKAGRNECPDRIRNRVGPSRKRLVASLAHPGGNVTGLSIQQTDLAAKKLELLREAVPDFRRLAILANVGSPASVLEKGEVEAAARTFSLDVAPVEIRRAEDIVSAFLALKGRAEALCVCGDALIANNRSQIARDGCRRTRRGRHAAGLIPVFLSML